MALVATPPKKPQSPANTPGPIRPPVKSPTNVDATPTAKKRRPKTRGQDDLGEALDKAQESALVNLFAEAHSRGENLSPDGAMGKLHEQIRGLIGDPSALPASTKRKAARVPRKSGVARQKLLHHLAVDLFYKTYFPEESKRGRPPLPEAESREITELREAGATWAEIPAKLGDPAGSKDKYRKRVTKTHR
jgi:hypothetical protein